MRVLVLLQHVEQVQEGPEDESVSIVVGIGFARELVGDQGMRSELRRLDDMLSSLTRAGGPVSVCVLPDVVCP